MIPQIIMLLLMAFGVGAAAAEDGKPRTGYESFGHTFIGVLIQAALLYWGGFFDVFWR